jgi:tRNA (guanosine-2'-O-)-methyltransferase
MTADLLPAYLDYLLPMVSDHKRELFLQHVEHRTRFLTVVLEDIYQPHNASAVLRSCDCFGVQDVHIIENRNRFAVIGDIVLGSAKWLTLQRYKEKENNTRDALLALKEKGYKIIGTTPHHNGVNLEDYPMDVPTALVFGTEKDGLTPEALELCDGYLQVPMVGFTESLNISVCAAICLHHLTLRMRQSGVQWQLPDAEKTALLVDWALEVTGNGELLEKNFMEKVIR